MNNFRQTILFSIVLIFYSNTTASIFKSIKLPNPFPKNKIGATFDIFAITRNPFIESSKKLYAFADNAAQKLKLNQQNLYTYKSKNTCDEYNAFAGFYENISGVFFGELLLQRWEEGWLTDQEIEALIAHEMSHIKCNHPIKGGIFNLIVSGPMLLGRITTLPPDPKTIVKNTYSRKLEKEADLKAISIIDDPIDLFNALVKIECLHAYAPDSIEDFQFSLQITQNDLLKQKSNMLSPLIELLSSHPLTSTRMAYIKKNAKTKP